MRVSSVLFPVMVLILFISLLSIWFYPSVQDFMSSNTMWNGLRTFSREFSAASINSLDDLPEFPENTVLIAIPYRGYSDKELSRIKSFVNNGGTLLLMDDYGYSNSILAYLGASIRFSNKPLLDPLFCYKNQTIPRITDFASRVKESGVGVIMLNHATTLTGAAESEVIVWSSSASFLDINENGDPDEGEPGGPFVVAAEFRLDKGAIDLVADPSIIINSMVGKDNNYDFIRYFTSRNGGLQQKVMIDYSHLTQAPLDVSKTRLRSTREILSSPYALLGITGLIFIVVSRYTLKKGETVG